MIRACLQLVASQSPEAMLALRQFEVWEAWFTLCCVPHLPQSWFAWVSALERLEGERLRFIHQARH